MNRAAVSSGAIATIQLAVSLNCGNVVLVVCRGRLTVPLSYLIIKRWDQINEGRFKAFQDSR